MHKIFIFSHNLRVNFHNPVQYLSVWFMDLHPYGCIVNFAHCFHLTYPLCTWPQSRAIKVSFSLWSLTFQAQAQASPSPLYSPSYNPYFLTKDFLHKKISRVFIESYSRGNSLACVTTTQHILGRSWITIGSSCPKNILFHAFHLSYPTSHMYYTHTMLSPK